MTLPRFSPTRVRPGEAPERIASRNFDHLAQVLGGAFDNLEEVIAALTRSMLSKADVNGMIRRHAAVYNIKDYGASPSLADNGPAIQKAYDAAKYYVDLSLGTGGAIVEIPPGRYVASTPMVFNSAFVTVHGHGRTATELVTSGSGTSFVKFYGGASTGNPLAMACEFYGVKISYGGSGTWTNLLHLVNLSDMEIYDLWIEGGWPGADYCVRGESALFINFKDCKLRYGNKDCLYLTKLNTGTVDGEAYPNTITLNECDIARGREWGLHYRDGYFMRVINCKIEHNGDTKDINHGGAFFDHTDFEAGAGNSFLVFGTHFEDSTGVDIRIGNMGTGGASHGSIIFSHGIGGNKIHSVYGDITSPERGRVDMQYCSFFNATTYDYYFLNDFVADLYHCQGFTQSLTSKCSARPYPNNNSFSQTELGVISYLPQEFNAGETTPTCNYVSPFKYFNNSVATTVTKFLGCGDGAYLLIYSPNANTTLKHRSSGGAGATDEIDCPGNVDYRISAGESVWFFRINNHWYPAGFSGPFNGPATFNKAVSIAGNLNISDHVIFTAKTLNVRYDTSTGTTDARLCLSPAKTDGGVVAEAAYIDLRGVTNGVPGRARMAAGNVAGGDIVLATGNDVAALTVNDDQTVSLSNDLKLASGKVVKVNGTQVLAGQQTGLGASLASRTAGATYDATAQTMLQEAHDKIRLLEAKLKTHGIVAT